LKATAGKWNIVIIGAWNTRLLGAAWLSKHIFDGKNVEGYIALIPGFPNKYVHEGIEVEPTDERLVLGVRVPSDENLRLLEQKTCQLLKFLEHTPVQAIGFNLAMEVDSIQDARTLEEQLDNVGSILSANGYERSEIALSQKLTRDGTTFSVTMLNKGGSVATTFNFHTDVDSAGAACEAIKDKVIGMKEEALRFLEEVYDLRMEEQETE
jgi:hypothetical protein